jgi:hypothetical protein
METENIKDIPIFFIMGRPRSGTTLLTTLFNAHPNVRIAPEFPVMIFLYQKFRNVKVWDEAAIRSFIDHAFYFSKTSKINSRRVNNLKIDKEFILQELLRYKPEEASLQLFMKSINYYAYSIYSKEKTLLIGDKNPVYSVFAHRFRKIFPDAKFICIIRDYRDNFISIKKLADKEVAVEAPSVPLQVGRWKFFVSRFLKLKKRFPDRYYILRYEDLVTDQEKTFRSICGFLGIPFTPAVFEYYQKKDVTLQTYGNPTWEKFHSNVLKPINTGSMNTWQNEMTPKQVRMADHIAGKYADKLGYARENKKFSLGLYLKALPLLAYNYILLSLMVFGSYLPFKVSQWWFLKSLLLLKTYLFFKGKKSFYGKHQTD